MKISFDPQVAAECNAAVQIMLSFGWKMPGMASVTAAEAAAPAAPAPIAPNDNPETGSNNPFVSPAPAAPPATSQAAPIASSAPPAPSAEGTEEPAAGSVTPVAGVVPVDTTNLPWDERIHSKSSDGTLPVKADGTWRQKRGVNTGTVALVTGELRSKGYPYRDPNAASASPPAAPAAPAPAPAAAPPAPFAPPATSAATPGPMTFAQLAKAIQQAGYSQEQVTEACVANGLPNFPALVQAPDKIAAVAAALYLA